MACQLLKAFVNPEAHATPIAMVRILGAPHEIAKMQPAKTIMYIIIVVTIDELPLFVDSVFVDASSS